MFFTTSIHHIFNICTYNIHTYILYIYIYILCRHIWSHIMYIVFIFIWHDYTHHTIFFRSFGPQICSEVQGFIVTVLGPCGQGTSSSCPMVKRWSWDFLSGMFPSSMVWLWDKSHIFTSLKGTVSLPLKMGWLEGWFRPIFRGKLRSFQGG